MRKYCSLVGDFFFFLSFLYSFLSLFSIVFFLFFFLSVRNLRVVYTRINPVCFFREIVDKQIGNFSSAPLRDLPVSLLEHIRYVLTLRCVIEKRDRKLSTCHFQKKKKKENLDSIQTIIAATSPQSFGQSDTNKSSPLSATLHVTEQNELSQPATLLLE